MVIATLVPLSTVGSLMVGGLLVSMNHRRRQRQAPPLVTQLVTAPPMPVESILAQSHQPSPKALFSTNQHLVVSTGLVGLTTVGRWGLPLLRTISLPGLLYLDLYFMGQAFFRWRTTGQVGIETNDAVLVTGLLATRQLGAAALFATFFFTSRKLQELTAAGLAKTTASVEVAGTAPVSTTSLSEGEQRTGWQRQIDHAALPLLALSVVSTPVLGFHRALSVLLANFGYDYRVLAPLSTLRYLKVAKAQGIWVQDGQVFETLHQIDVVLLAGQHQTDAGAPPPPMQLPEHKCYQIQASSEPVATQIMQWQAQGQRVAYVCTTLDDYDAVVQADVVIQCGDSNANRGKTQVHAQVILQSPQPEQLQQLFALAAAHHATQQRGLALAVAPSFMNLWGIYFWQFDVIAALLIDYGGMGLGLINALHPQGAVGLGTGGSTPAKTTLLK